MSDRKERGSNVTDRLSRRFENEKQRSEDSEPSGSSKRSKPSQEVEKSEKGVNVKKDWTGRYMYLPDEVDSVFDSEYDRLVYECGRDLDWKPKKNRHYYPVAVKHGIDAVVKMDGDEFRDAVDEMQLR